MAFRKLFSECHLNTFVVDFQSLFLSNLCLPEFNKMKEEEMLWLTLDHLSKDNAFKSLTRTVL